MREDESLVDNSTSEEEGGEDKTYFERAIGTKEFPPEARLNDRARTGGGEG